MPSVPYKAPFAICLILSMLIVTTFPVQEYLVAVLYLSALQVAQKKESISAFNLPGTWEDATAVVQDTPEKRAQDSVDRPKPQPEDCIFVAYPVQYEIDDEALNGASPASTLCNSPVATSIHSTHSFVSPIQPTITPATSTLLQEAVLSHFSNEGDHEQKFQSRTTHATIPVVRCDPSRQRPQASSTWREGQLFRMQLPPKYPSFEPPRLRIYFQYDELLKAVDVKADISRLELKALFNLHFPFSPTLGLLSDLFILRSMLQGSYKLRDISDLVEGCCISSAPIPRRFDSGLLGRHVRPVSWQPEAGQGNPGVDAWGVKVKDLVLAHERNHRRRTL